MSCQGRTWPDIGRKLLSRRALQAQRVHRRDSVLGPLRHSSGMGLDATYEDLIKQAFAPRFWSAGVDPHFGKPGYSGSGFSQSEVNFSFFFGIATQLYAGTLISDDTRFDHAIIEVNDSGEFVDLNPDPTARLTSRELNGLRLFNEAHCIFCHNGPLFSSATDRKTLHHDGDVILRTMVKRQRSDT
jgi:cytochrome c peroxidase